MGMACRSGHLLENVLCNPAGSSLRRDVRRVPVPVRRWMCLSCVGMKQQWDSNYTAYSKQLSSCLLFPTAEDRASLSTPGEQQEQAAGPFSAQRCPGCLSTDTAVVESGCLCQQTERKRTKPG